MCGRINVSSGPLTLLFMDMVSQPYPGEDRHNMAPTEPVVVLRSTALGALETATMRWWLTPYWSKEMSTRYSMFNAKAETLATSAAFKEPLVRRRCVVPIAGFYEWAKLRTPKIAYHASVYPPHAFALAAIWEAWRRDRQSIETFAILTTTPNGLVGKVHDRMPVMIRPEDFDKWLDRGTKPPKLKHLFKPYPAKWMALAQVGDWVDDPRHDDPRCLAPPAEAGKE